MSTLATPKIYTPDDLLKMPDGDRYELVNGNLVERNMSFLSSYIAGKLHRILGNYCDQNRLGWVVTEGTSYQCFTDDPNRVRKAGVSFINSSRLSPEQAAEEGHMPVVPDLVVEVISPNDLYYEVESKASEWLQAGVRLLWVVNPRNRQVRVYHPDGSAVTLRVQDELSCEDVIPGFHCRVEELFRLPAGTTPS